MVMRYTYQARPWTMNRERRGDQHWSQTRLRTAEWRKAFWALGIQQRRRFERASITVEVFMRAPVADTGACYPAVKAAIDGLVDAGVLPGDTGQHLPSITFLAPIRVGKDQVERLTLVLEPTP
jgi:hypothetical protein